MPFSLLSSTRLAGTLTAAFPFLGAALLVCAGCKPAAPVASAPPPAEVAVHVVTSRRLTITQDFPGRIEPVRVAQVRARVAGILMKRSFAEGSDVQAGQTLFQIDPAQFEANLASAEASLAKAEASRQQAQATLDRYKTLVAAEAISRQDFDLASAAALQTTAEVQVARAAVANAKLSLGYASVTAPISGRIGRALVTEGALVGQNETTPLATIQQLDPVYFDFTQSSTDVLRLRRALAAGELRSIAPGAAQVTLLLEDGTVYAHSGRLLFADISVDPATGMVTLRAEFPNPDRILLPGMFARGRLEQAVQEAAVTAPMRGIARGAAGTATAMVVNAEDKVEVRPVTLGSALGDKWIVTAGLKPGDRIIVEGVQKARPGALVKPVPATPPVAGGTRSSGGK